MNIVDQIIMDLIVIVIVAVCLYLALDRFGYLLGGLKW